MTAEPIRTWTLSSVDLDLMSRADVLSPALTVDEVEPMLDLLQAWFAGRPLRRADNPQGRALDERTLALLREHGRLSDHA